MSRVIKFRAWHIHGTMIDWDALQNHSMHFIFGYGTLTLMQYTGLTDRNGKEIYESDVISDNIGIGQVEYREKRGGYLIKYQDGTAKWFIDYTDNEIKSIEVIGNVFDSHSKLPQNT